MSLIRYQDPELTTWSPFDRLVSLRDEMNRLFDGSFPKFRSDGGLFNGWNPTVDIYQDKDHVIVKAELPGMKKEEIEISLHDGMLTISGERKHEEESKEGETYRSERYFGKFHRTVVLPAAVDSRKVRAAYKEGILKVTLPKTDEAKPKQIEVNIN